MLRVNCEDGNSQAQKHYFNNQEGEEVNEKENKTKLERPSLLPLLIYFFFLFLFHHHVSILQIIINIICCLPPPSSAFSAAWIVDTQAFIAHKTPPGNDVPNSCKVETWREWETEKINRHQWWRVFIGSCWAVHPCIQTDDFDLEASSVRCIFSPPSLIQLNSMIFLVVGAVNWKSVSTTSIPSGWYKNRSWRKNIFLVKFWEKVIENQFYLFNDGFKRKKDINQLFPNHLFLSFMARVWVPNEKYSLFMVYFHDVNVGLFLFYWDQDSSKVNVEWIWLLSLYHFSFNKLRLSKAIYIPFCKIAHHDDDQSRRKLFCFRFIVVVLLKQLKL